MNYQQFKKIIETQKVNETLYQTLIEANGAKKTHNLFERYINSSNGDNQQEVYDRVAVYLNHIQEDNQEDYLSEVPDFDILGFYLKEINKIPLLTDEEEKVMTKKINELKNKLQEKNISRKNLTAKLAELDIKGNNLLIMQKQLEILITNSKDSENILELKSLLNDLKLYIYFDTLINKFIEHNLRLVPPIAKKYTYSGISILDLIQEGNIGLKKAIIKFKIEKKCKFSTYADFWINHNIRISIPDHLKMFSLPLSVNEELRILSTLENKLETSLNRAASDKELLEEFYKRAESLLIKSGNLNPSKQEIIEKAKMTEEKIRRLRKLQEPIVYLSTPVGEEEDTTLMEFVSDETRNTEKEAINNIDKLQLKKSIKCLKLRFQFIIILRHGLALNKYMSFEKFEELIAEENPTLTYTDLQEIYIKYSNTYEEITLEEIGEVLNLSKQRLSKLEQKANQKLNYYFKNIKSY